MLLTPTDT